MTRVHLVHGIHTRIDDPKVKGLIPYLKDFEVFYPDYGWIAGLETKVVNPRIVEILLPYIQPGDIFIGHSNGCAIGYDLMNRGAPFGGMVFINAALEQNIQRQKQMPWIDVYYNSGDEITEAAKVAEELGLVDKVWGEMGHAGYYGQDSRICNINCGQILNMPKVSGHSDIFKEGKLDQGWGYYIAGRILAHLQ